MQRSILDIDPVPRDPGDALLRDIVSILPVVGDVLDAIELIRAVEERDLLAAIAYLLAALPGPELPLTHLLLYLLEGRTPTTTTGARGPGPH